MTTPVASDAPPSASDTPIYVLHTATGYDPGLQWTGVAGLSRMSDHSIVSRGVQLIETTRDKRRDRRGSDGDDDVRRMREIWQYVVQSFQALQPNTCGVEAYTTYVPGAWSDLKDACQRLTAIGVPATHRGFIEQITDIRTARPWIEAVHSIATVLRDARAFEGFGLGHAAKTIGVQWIVASVAWAYNVEAHVYTPTTVHTKVVGRGASTKEDVGEAMMRRVIGLRQHIDVVRARNEREDSESDAADRRASHVSDAAALAWLALLDYERGIGFVARQ